MLVLVALDITRSCSFNLERKRILQEKISYDS